VLKHSRKKRNFPTGSANALVKLYSVKVHHQNNHHLPNTGKKRRALYFAEVHSVRRCMAPDIPILVAVRIAMKAVNRRETTRSKFGTQKPVVRYFRLIIMIGFQRYIMVTNSSEGGILSRNRRVEAADSSNSSVL